MFPAARIGDPVSHDGISPSGVIAPPLEPPVAGMVLIEGLPAAHVLCTVACSGATSGGLAHPPPTGALPAPPIIVGCPTVLINGKPAARWISGDLAACGSMLGDARLAATRSVFIGTMNWPSAPPVATGLGKDIDLLVSISPTLHQQIRALLEQKWSFIWGKPGGGSYCVRTNPKHVVVDSNKKGRLVDVALTLAHEVGHAQYTLRPDTSSKQRYIDSKLADEGAATLNNIKVQRDLNGAGGPDIGIAGNPDNHSAYNAAYDRYQQDGDAAAARDSIGSTFGSGETASVPVNGKYVTYNEYYGADWKAP